jgi:hypothetical protein
MINPFDMSHQPWKSSLGKGNRGVTHLTKSLFTGPTTIEACQESDWEVRRCTTTLRPSCSCPSQRRDESNVAANALVDR